MLERFTRREFNNEKSNGFCKMIFNARKISHVDSPHAGKFFEGLYAINETGAVQMHPGKISPPLTEKIVVNHYHCKSWEEYQMKQTRGDAVFISNTKYTRNLFNGHDCNDEFDDGILRYRDDRAKIFKPRDLSRINERLLNALMINLSPTLLPTTPQDFYRGKMETFLTCRAVSSYLQTTLPDAAKAQAKFFEEASLKAILRSFGGMTLPDARLFLKELPQLLSLPYPVVKDIRQAALYIIPRIMDMFHLNNVMWKDYVELDYLQNVFKINA